MASKSKLAWILLAGAALLLVGWWTLVPRLGQATEAEVRARFAPELLHPVAHPAGGRERYKELLRLQAALPKARVPDRRHLDADDPLVRQILALLEQGPLDRSGAGPYERFHFVDLGMDLVREVPALAASGQWPAVEAQMAAACLLLDRLFEGDASQWDRFYSMVIDERLLRTALQLAGRGDLPAATAERLDRSLVVDRNTPAALLKVFRTEVQSGGFTWLSEPPQGVYAGTFEPLETAELISARLLEVSGNAGRALQRESRPRGYSAPDWYWRGQYLPLEFGPIAGPGGIRIPLAGTGLTPLGVARRGTWRDDMRWAINRIRMNTSHNSYGRLMADELSHSAMIRRIPRERSLQDKVAAALAVVMFRSRLHRDPQGYEELVSEGLLRAAPRDHELDKPLPFDLQSLFRWSQDEERP